MTHANVEAHYDGPEQPPFPGVPEELGSVAQHCLEEQNEADPLIVGVVLLGVFVSKVIAHSWMGDFYADLTSEGVRHGERRSNPAEGVDGMGRQPIDDTLNRITHVLSSCDHQRTGDEKYGCERVV